MIINHNMSALFAHRVYSLNENNTSRDIEKLASGLRITRAADDASGLAVSEKMRAQIRGLKAASRNASDGISFIQTVEGYLQESQDILQRIRELSVQSANGIYSAEDRLQIQVEVSQLVDEIDRISSQAQYNGLNMLTGRFAQFTGTTVVTASMWFHIGANMDQREQVHIGTMTAEALGIRFSTTEIMSLSNPDSANRSIGLIDAAMKKVNKQRADLGSYQNRLEMSIQGLDIAAENIQSAESRIRDLDMAKGITSFTKNQILLQASSAMIAQANAKGQSILQLLQ